MYIYLKYNIILLLLSHSYVIQGVPVVEQKSESCYLITQEKGNGCIEKSNPFVVIAVCGRWYYLQNKHKINSAVQTG
jgi:hypothetical protein